MRYVPSPPFYTWRNWGQSITCLNNQQWQTDFSRSRPVSKSLMLALWAVQVLWACDAKRVVGANKGFPSQNPRLNDATKEGLTPEDLEHPVACHPHRVSFASLHSSEGGKHWCSVLLASDKQVLAHLVFFFLLRTEKWVFHTSANH